MTWRQDSQNLGDTERIAVAIGQRLQGGEVIELISDLGGGKTTFTKGLTKGMGSTDTVGSPSFTISKQYSTPDDRLTLHHYDFYRLQDAGILLPELVELIQDRHNVIVIEWGEVVQSVLPTDRLTITIMKTGDTSRRLDMVAGGEMALRLKGTV